ncbi:sigma-54-dependent Fis family transcriptional regulator [Desulfosporosinus fructosivorans]|nr:sigma-54-dependent Fis family transcriptional regulator [Desulfosporosinus fructosivorans]
MQYFSLSSANEYQELFKAWQEYFEQGITPKSIRPVILESWKKARELNADPFSSITEGSVLEGDELRLKLEEKKELIACARPFMQILFDVVKGSGFVVLLTDENATMLHVIGDAEIMDQGKFINVVPGGDWSNRAYGNSALTICLESGEPIQVVAAEHVKKDLHDWTCSTAPIHNSEGMPIGALSMSGNFRYTNRHTLGMVVAATLAIEKNLAERLTSNKLASSNKYLNTILDSMSEGLICIDTVGNVTMANEIAKELLGFKGDRTADNIVPQNCLEILTKVIITGKAVEDEEVYYEANHGRFYYTLTAKPIYGPDSMVIGVVGILRAIKSVKKLVNRMAGATASFIFSDLIGSSLEFNNAISLAKTAARTSSSVVLQGESGVGKELFAQSIHNASMRKEGPFVAINCAAIPRELMASELFGYSKGAFTGARSDGKPGKFEMADEGTLFLDEIGDMPIDLQVSLLRILENKQLTRLGDNKVISVDVRIIAATNKNLKLEITKNNFRADLYYRLKVFQIQIPALRERKDDLDLLVKHFIDKINCTAGTKIMGIDEKALRVISDYHWPGNIRELQNILEQAIYMAKAGILQPKHLPEDIKKFPANISINKNLSLKTNEVVTICNALQEAGGEISRAAKILGIGRNTLYRKLDKYQIRSLTSS